MVDGIITFRGNVTRKLPGVTPPSPTIAAKLCKQRRVPACALEHLQREDDRIDGSDAGAPWARPAHIPMGRLRDCTWVAHADNGARVIFLA